MSDPEKNQGGELFSGVGEHLEQVKGETAGLLETAAFTVQMRRVIMEHLERGNIPLMAMVNEEGEVTSLQPVVPEEILRGCFAELGVSQEVIDERIETIKKETGLYQE